MHANILYMSKTNIRVKTKFQILSLWILFTILLASLVLWPIYSNNVDYRFYFNNILFIAVFIIFFRYIFFIKTTFLENKIYIKLLIVALAIFFDIYAYMALNDFINFYQENGKYSQLTHLVLEKQYSIGNFIFNQYIFFGVAALVSGIIIPFRMLISVWRVHNKGSEG